MATKTFKYIKIPAGDEPIQELEYTGVVELTQDTFVDSLRQQFSASGGAANMDVLMNNMSQHAKQDVEEQIKNFKSMKFSKIFSQNHENRIHFGYFFKI